MDTSKKATLHSVERTSPKGEKFVGTCVLCGKTGITAESVLNDPCPNPRGVTPDQAILDAIYRK